MTKFVQLFESSLPSTGFIRLATILKIIPVGKTTWWAGVKSGRFPQPVKLGVRVTAWRVEDIHLLIEQMGQRQNLSFSDGNKDASQ